MDIHHAHLPAHTRPPVRDSGGQDPALHRTARELETAFLSELLRAAGAGRATDSPDGGQGEDPFASFMVEAQARAMVAAGGLGLADAIATALARQAGMEQAGTSTEPDR